MQGRKLKHILNRQNTSHPSNVFCFSRITNANLQCTVCCILAPCILKIYFSKCIPQNVSKYISQIYSSNMCIAVWQNVFSRYVSQNVFPKMYFPKCIFQNVSLKMYFPKCVELDAITSLRRGTPVSNAFTHQMHSPLFINCN